MAEISEIIALGAVIVGLIILVLGAACIQYTERMIENEPMEKYKEGGD